VHVSHYFANIAQNSTNETRKTPAERSLHSAYSMACMPIFCQRETLCHLAEPRLFCAASLTDTIQLGSSCKQPNTARHASYNNPVCRNLPTTLMSH